MKKTIVAIVPARGGSKRLPGKNIKPLAGRPLVFHTLDALVNQKYIDKVIFTSDSDEYLKAVGDEFGNAVNCIKRPEYYGADTTKVHDEIIRLAEAGELGQDWFMLCLPTAPFRNHAIVSDMINDWEKDSIARFSASEYGFPIQFGFSIDQDGNWVPDMKDSPMITGNTRSQDIPKRYRPNGAMYLQTVDSLFKNKTFYLEAKPYLMAEKDSIDIDNEEDFIIAEQLWKLRNEK